MSDNDYSPGQLISKYQEHLESIKYFEEQMKPYQEAAGNILNTLHEMLLTQGLQNFKSDAGTAYLSHTLSARVTDRDKFLAFIRLGNWNFLDARVLKEPVRELMAEQEAAVKKGQRPISVQEIGLTTETIVKCHIRKST
jgi:hypothetical protein